MPRPRAHATAQRHAGVFYSHSADGRAPPLTAVKNDSAHTSRWPGASRSRAGGSPREHD
eukprot:CAMPEP_0168359416 /NCGR_PEP_ID=MMETSP0228-20121227/1632_1 /TAXON_ID=133427 /ORGANISM="Protoceratium reticulatum, Strain CCCM 535 (=CCMP 1889)" /LENGTH=58 /DNA_ID=CAMNT_0008372047 /DNA_START=58 /DNA_END=234 /DNA_ORIENTATION=-